jgi:hypothetical protein
MYNGSMKRQDVLSILITFTVGFIGGGFLYVTHFAKLVNPDSVQTQEAAMSFSITGEAYGGCDGVCPAFQMLSNGTYRYQFYEEVGGEKEFREGTMPSDVRRSVRAALDTEALTKQSQEIEPSDCNSYNNDGIDVRYDIALDGAEYTLDSCGTAVEGEGEVWNSLAKIWSYFETLD